MLAWFPSENSELKCTSLVRHPGNNFKSIREASVT